MRRRCQPEETGRGSRRRGRRKVLNCTIKKEFDTGKEEHTSLSRIKAICYSDGCLRIGVVILEVRDCLGSSRYISRARNHNKPSPNSRLEHGFVGYVTDETEVVASTLKNSSERLPEIWNGILPSGRRTSPSSSCW